MSRGDASVQSAAEAALRAGASRLLGADLAARRLYFPDGNCVAVDAVADEPPILCEIFARIGTLKGGQIKKVAEDLLKLVTVRRLLPEWRDARTVLVFASDEARSSVRGWLLIAVQAWDGELLTVPVEAEMREQLLSAQQEQWMGYPASPSSLAEEAGASPSSVGRNTSATTTTPGCSSTTQIARPSTRGHHPRPARSSRYPRSGIADDAPPATDAGYTGHQFLYEAGAR